MEGRAKPSSSWVDFTTVPYEDGYEWRKLSARTPADTDQAQSSASAEPDHGPTAGALASDGPQEDRPKRPRTGNPRYTGPEWISK